MPDVLLIEGAHVLTMDSGTRRHGELSIAVWGDRIAGLGSPAELAARFPSASRFDARGTIAIPGLINAHLHPEDHLLRGWLEGLDLHQWRRVPHLAAARDVLDGEAGGPLQRAGIRAAFAEAILSGTTCIAAYGVTIGANELSADLLTEFGIHGHTTIRDVEFRPVGSGPAHALAPPRMYRLHAEESLTTQELEAAAAAARRGERIVMHAAETRARIRLVRRRFGQTTVRLLAHHGLLSPRMLLSHAVYVDDEESDILAATGACVVASPAAEMKLGDGIAPIAGYLERGIPVALGTDAAICNNGTDLLLEARMLGLTQSLRGGPDGISALDLLRCATVHGAAALGEADRRGRLAEGLVADLVLVDARNVRIQPLLAGPPVDNVAAGLVHAGTGRDVRDVMAGGRWIVRNGRGVGFNEVAIADELSAAAAELMERVASSAAS